MTRKSSRFERFWQELKRRKVFGVVAPYAATAYIIIEITNNLAVPLHLPGWFATLELIILLIGLPVVIVLSWIFDFTPKGIKKTESLGDSEKEETLIKPAKRRLRPSYVLNAVLIIAVIILAYPKIFKQGKGPSDDRISVAVMPFQNMTNDTTWNIWENGIQTNLITSLTGFEEFKVRQMETIKEILKSNNVTNYASLTPSFASSLSRKLNSKLLVYGSINQSGSTIRVNAQLIDAKTEEAIKSFQIDGTERMIFKIIDSLSILVRNSLIVSKMSELAYGTYVLEHLRSVNSPEAYRYFVYGQIAWDKMQIPAAIDWYLKALSIDSNLLEVYPSLTLTYYNIGNIKQAKEWYLKYTKKLDKLPEGKEKGVDWFSALIFETPKERIKLLQQMKDMDDQNAMAYFNTGDQYSNELMDDEKAIPEYEKAIEIFDNWGIIHPWVPFYSQLGNSYHKTGQYRKEKKLYERIEKEHPEGSETILDQQAFLFFTLGDTARGNSYLNKWISYQRDQSASEADIASGIGSWIYAMAGMPDKSEEYLRKALALEPEELMRMTVLGYFLVDKDRNINEGLELAEKVLQKNPESVSALHIKGWALYKQGKYQEALDLLQKSWDLRMKNYKYNHSAYLHLEEAKKAVAGQKN